MPFCSNCGAAYDAGAKFCPSCGAPLAAAPSNAGAYGQNAASAPPLSAKEEELRRLSGAIAYFGQKEAAYHAYDRANDRIMRSSRGKRHALLIWGVILTSVGALLSLFLAVVLFSSPNKVSFMAFFIISFIYGLFFTFPGIGMIIGYTAYSSSYERKRLNAYQTCDDLLLEFWRHYRACQNCPVPYEYTHPDNLKAIYMTIFNGRAQSIADAISQLTNYGNACRASLSAIQYEMNVRANAVGAGGAPYCGMFFN